jgi:uncharacterized membrane protein
MPDLVALAYADEHRAAEVLGTLRRLHAGVFANVHDALYIVRRTDWTVRLGREHDLGAVEDGCMQFWRRFISGLILTPGVARLHGNNVEHPLEQGFKRQLAAALPPGSSALFLVVPPDRTESVATELLCFGGLVLSSTFNGYPDGEPLLQD